MTYLKLPHIVASTTLTAFSLLLSSNGFAQKTAFDVQPVLVESTTVIQLEGVSVQEDIWTTTPVISGRDFHVRFGNWIDKDFETNCEIRNSKGQLVVDEEVMISDGVEVQFVFDRLQTGEYTFTANNSGQIASIFFEVEGGEKNESVQRTNSGQLSIYPNPIRGRKLNLEIGDWIDSQELTAIRITDLYGQPLIDKTMRLEPNVLIRIDVSSLEIGEFILVVVNGREKQTARFTVLR